MSRRIVQVDRNRSLFIPGVGKEPIKPPCLA